MCINSVNGELMSRHSLVRQDMLQLRIIRKHRLRACVGLPTTVLNASGSLHQCSVARTLYTGVQDLTQQNPPHNPEICCADGSQVYQTLQGLHFDESAGSMMHSILPTYTCMMRFEMCPAWSYVEQRTYTSTDHTCNHGTYLDQTQEHITPLGSISRGRSWINW